MTLEELYDLSDRHPIVFYDGVCYLCNGFVRLVINNDRDGLVKFCLLQNDSGLSLRERLSLGSDINTTIGIYRREIYTHSDVLYMVAQSLGGWWLLLSPLYLLPKSFRDMIYNWVASNRYKWFGQSDECIVPEPSVRSRFINSV